MKYLLFILIIVSISRSYSAERYAGKVTFVLGQASVLYPHSKEAVAIQKWQKIMEDSSILTKNKSVVRVKMINKSLITIGPKSKYVVSSMSEKKGVIKLLIGTMRAKLKQNKERTKKLYIKTQTASMGVRGTEFQISFNPKNKLTGLLTYKGEVAIKKSNKNIFDIETIETSNIENDLDEQTHSIKKGDYINLGKKIKNLTQKVKIDPVQFVLLEKDDSLGATKKTINLKEVKKEAIIVKKEFLVEINSKETSAERNFGYLDSTTSLYIPPMKNNPKKKVGKITSTGKYVAPKGTKLDATKGFLLKNTDNLVALKNFEDINSEIIKDINNPSYKRYFDLK